MSIRFGAGAPDPPTIDFLKTMTVPNLQKLTLQFIPGTRFPVDGSLLPEPLLWRCLPKTLTHISLYYVKIEYANEVLPDEFAVLKHLELVECDNVEMLLNNYSRPTLETFTYRHDCIEQVISTVASTAVLEFLRRFQYLSRLTLDCQECLTSFESTASSAIMSHAASLEYLLINCETAHLEGPYGGSFLEAASKCKRLKQLSISFRVSDYMELGAVRRERGIFSSSLTIH